MHRELRSREAAGVAVVVTLTFLVTYLFAVGPAPTTGTQAAIIFVPLLYAGIASAGRSFSTEADGGTLPLLQMAPVPLGYHGISRTLVQVVLQSAIGLVTLGLARLVWGVEINGSLLLVVWLCGVGIATTGTLTGGLTIGARTRDLLLPVVAVPALFPLIQAGINGIQAATVGGNWQTAAALIAGYDLLMLGAAWILWPILLEGE